jgi:DNA-binding beta-propeller fold protein YncE
VRRLILVLACGLISARGSTSVAAGPEYLVYVASEAADRISLVRFSPGAAKVEREIPTGLMPTSIDGPHGLAVSPDARWFYVSLAHGQPFGALWKYSTADNQPAGRVTLGSFPATLQISPGGDFAYVVNFNLHGDRVPSSVSVVETSTMTEVKRITTCMMPHGSRLDSSGARHYSACMMDDTLVEIDTSKLRVSRHFVTTAGKEHGADGPPVPAAPDSTEHAGHGADAATSATKACSPTWAQPSADDRSVFVACNGSNELVEIDVAAWKLVRRIRARQGIYNLAVTGDGKLVATNRRDQTVSIFDLASGKEATVVPLPRKAAHGVVISPDQKYAFVSVEGVGAEPGTVVMIDLASGRISATAEVAPQAGGIDVWRKPVNGSTGQRVNGSAGQRVNGSTGLNRRSAVPLIR